MLRRVLTKHNQLERISQKPDSYKYDKYLDELDTLTEEMLPKLFESLESHFRSILGVMAFAKDKN